MKNLALTLVYFWIKSWHFSIILEPEINLIGTFLADLQQNIRIWHCFTVSHHMYLESRIKVKRLFKTAKETAHGRNHFMSQSRQSVMKNESLRWEWREQTQPLLALSTYRIYHQLCPITSKLSFKTFIYAYLVLSWGELNVIGASKCQ